MFTVEKWIDRYLPSLLAYCESILSKHPSLCNFDAVVGPNERQESHSVNQAGTQQRTPTLLIWTNELNFMVFVVQRESLRWNAYRRCSTVARNQPWATSQPLAHQLWGVFDSVSRSKLKFNVKCAAMRPRHDRLSSHAAPTIRQCPSSTWHRIVMAEWKLCYCSLLSAVIKFERVAVRNSACR